MFPKGLRHDMKINQRQRGPQAALHPSISITVDVCKFHRTCWQLNWETKCSILLTCVINEAFFLMYPGMTQSMQVKKTKPVSSLSTAAHLCSCLQLVPEPSGLCLPTPFGLLTSVNTEQEQAALLSAAADWLVEFKFF